jgi:hypothetical protein
MLPNGARKGAKTPNPLPTLGATHTRKECWINNKTIAIREAHGTQPTSFLV